MRPKVWIDPESLRANALAWRSYAGLPLRAVVKSDGYGWGFATLVTALDTVVDGYYVSDFDEFTIVRALTSKPIATLASVALTDLTEILERDGIPTISAVDGIAHAEAWARSRSRRARVRIALVSATGWSGFTADAFPALATELARAAPNLDVEFSSHVTDSSLAEEQSAAFVRARTLMLDTGVSIVASDLASTGSIAPHDATNASHVRVGVGLFGARLGAHLALTSALHVEAPIVERAPARGQRTGYGLDRAPEHGSLAVVRCGYGDGFPRMRDERLGILTVGMQFATLHAQTPFAADSVRLVDGGTDLDALAKSAGIAPHHLVAALGNANGRVRNRR